MAGGTIEEAKELAKHNPTKAEQMLKEIIATKLGMNEEAMKEYELALMELGALYRDQRLVTVHELFQRIIIADLVNYRRIDELAQLITTSRTVMSSFAKAKTAKIGM